MLDRPALLSPLRVSVVHTSQAGRLRFKRHIEVGRRHRGVILRNTLLGIGIVVASQLRIDSGCLIRGHASATAERHMFLCVRHTRETGRRLIPAHHKVSLYRDNRSE